MARWWRRSVLPVVLVPLAVLSSLAGCEQAQRSSPATASPRIAIESLTSSPAAHPGAAPHSATSGSGLPGTPAASVPGVGIRKKGVASAAYVWSDPARLRALQVSWLYGWSPWIPSRVRGLQTVPMFAVPKDITPAALQALRGEAKAGVFKYLLGFNEPDIKREANLSPAQAAALWPKLERTGLQLGSPAPGHYWDGWLDRFMALAKARNLRVDFIAVHYYVDFTNPRVIDQIRRSILRYHREYHKPIWVTEIGSMDIRTWGFKMVSPPSTAAALRFMHNATAMLDSLRCVARYAWYTDKSYATPISRWTSLYDSHNDMTRLGRAFSRVGTAR